MDRAPARAACTTSEPAFNGATRHRVDRGEPHMVEAGTGIGSLQRGHASPRGSSISASSVAASIASLQRGHASPRGSSGAHVLVVQHPRRPSTGPRVTAWIEDFGPDCALTFLTPSTGPRVTAWIEYDARALRLHVLRPSTGPRVTAWIEAVARRTGAATGSPFNGATRHRVDRDRGLRLGRAGGLPSTGPRVTAWIELPG